MGGGAGGTTAKDALHVSHTRDEYEPDMGHNAAITLRLRIGKESTKAGTANVRSSEAEASS